MSIVTRTPPTIFPANRPNIVTFLDAKKYLATFLEEPVTFTGPYYSLNGDVAQDLADYTLSGNTLKNESTYTPSTWAEWTKDAGIVGDSTGLEFTSNNIAWKNAILNTAFKTSTKYGLLYTTVSTSLTVQGYVDPNHTLTADNIYPVNTTGNKKAVFTTKSSITNTLQFSISSSEASGNKWKIKDIRIFELPAGSQIDTDFTNLTADQLSAKYPWISGTQSVGDCTLTSVGVNHFDGQWESGSVGTAGDLQVDATRVRTKNYIKVLPNQQYVISTLDGYTLARQCMYDSNFNFLQASGSVSFTTHANARYMKWAYASDTDLSTRCQCEKGTTATAHQPYTGNSQVITAVGDRVGSVANSVDNYGTRTKRDERIIIDGNLAWAGLNTVTNTYRMNVPNWGVGKNLYHPSADASNAIGYCSDGEFPVTATASMDIRHLSLYSNDTIFCAIEQSKVNAMAGATTIDKFKAYLNAYPIDLRYQLATPIVTTETAKPITLYPNGSFFVESSTGVLPEVILEAKYKYWNDFSGKGRHMRANNLAYATGSSLDVNGLSLDGIDDFGSFADNTPFNITAAPLAIFATINPQAPDSYIIAKYATGTGDMQFGIFYEEGMDMVHVYLENLVRASSSGGVPAGTLADVGFIWDGTNVKIFVNGVQSGSTGAYAGTLTSRANLYIGKMASTYFKGDIKNLAFYAGAGITEEYVLKERRNIMRRYTL